VAVKSEGPGNMMLEPGKESPDFTLLNDEGSEVRLSDFRGMPVVLYFYPKDDTEGCTKEACDFRDHWRAFQQAGAVILGVSPDSVASHRKFKAKYKLPFALLSDADHAVALAYGAWGPKKMYGREYEGILRTTVVIDADGRIARVFPKVKVKDHADDVLGVLRAMSAGER
jgi:peroxiredoxin Q/BCP